MANSFSIVIFQFSKAVLALLISFIYLNFLAAPRDMRDLVPWPGFEPVPPAVEVQSVSQWTNREVAWNSQFLTSGIMYLTHSPSPHFTGLHI